MQKDWGLRRFCAVGVGVVVSLLYSGVALADPEPAVSFTGFSAHNFGDYTVGWSFSVSQATEVTSLGYFDYEGNGLTGEHEVGIWTSAGVLVRSVVVPRGTSATLLHGFRYVPIPSTVLPPGNYVIGGQSNATDMFWATVTGFSTSRLITFGTPLYASSTTLRYPTIANTSVSPAYFGPGMLVSAAALDTPPTASAGADFSVDEGQPSVVLDGSGSSDSDRDALHYSWVQLPGGSAVTLFGATTARPTFTAPSVAPGGETLTFELTVTANGLTDTDTVSVTVVNVNHTPVADAGDNVQIAEGAPVTLNGTHSFDIDNDPFTYTWTQTSGPPVTLTDAYTARPTFVAPLVDSGGAAGVVATLTFELVVDDGFPRDAPAPGYGFEHVADTVTIEVTNVNNPPAADAGSDRTLNENTVTTLDGAGSSDPDGDALEYVWQQVAGPPVTLEDTTAATATITTPFVGPGGADLTFTLTVEDGYGGVAVDTVVVHVQNVNDPPLVSAARPTIACLWPPNHTLVPVGITGVSDPQNNATITITGVTQDEPAQGLGDGDTAIDAVVNGDGTVLLRAERSGRGNGRVYHIHFTASDLEGSAAGVVTVCVPHQRRNNAVDEGELYDSTN